MTPALIRYPKKLVDFCSGSLLVCAIETISEAAIYCWFIFEVVVTIMTSETKTKYIIKLDVIFKQMLEFVQ